MRIFYSALFYLALPYIFVRLLWRSRKNPEYAKRWSERLGKVSQNIPKGIIWWHCVSVGETLASIPLIKLFQQKHPNFPILITTMTPGGSSQVKSRLQNTVYHQYVPYDLAGIMSGFIRRLQPKCCILMETEIWPNMIYYCHQKNIPVLLANARLSKKSAQKYAKFASFFAQILSFINIIAAQNKKDGERFIKLGYPRQKLVVTGSIKFDMDISVDLIEKAKTLRHSFPDSSRSIWIAASTHRGEEEIILKAAKKLSDNLLILVPRHPERRVEILSLCQKMGLKTCLRSENQLPDAETKVFLIDTMGELLLFYAVSDIAFVGGSLVPKGGHNLLEPAALGLPVLSGESLYNFSEIERLLAKAGALIKIRDAENLAIQVKALLENTLKYTEMSGAGKQVIIQNKGATEKHLLLIDQLLAP